MYSVQEIVKKYGNIKDAYDFGVRTHNAKEAQNIANILDYYGLILLLEDGDSPINFGDYVCDDIIIIREYRDRDDWDVAGDYRTIEAIDYNSIDFTTLPKDITFEM